MEDKNIKEEVVDMEETEKVGFVTKMGTKIKKNAKVIAGAAVVVAVGVVAYAVGKKSVGIEIPAVMDGITDVADAVEEVTE